MNNISCDICLDLIPLVKDKVASKDSSEAVKNHIKNCSRCKELFDDIEIRNNMDIYKQNINDEKIISRLKNQLISIIIILMSIGSCIGVILSETSGMFYNLLIMPIIGGLGFYILRKKSYILIIGMFIFVYVYHLIKYLIEGGEYYTNIVSLLLAPSIWSLIYSGLCGLGVLIGFLLYIAFKKENK